MKPLRIVHMFPDLLNLYGDGGNVRCLQKRCEWRKIPVEVVCVNHGEYVDLATADIVFLGGGPDREQQLATTQLKNIASEMQSYVENDGVLLAICGGYQVLGKEWLLGQEVVEGLGILDIVTQRPLQKGKRLIGDIVLKSSIVKQLVVGYENHAGYTFLGKDMQPFGEVVSVGASGNNSVDNHDGVLYKNVIGTYLHGPLLSKNPQVADYLLQKAIERRTAKTKEQIVWGPLDDAVENEANEYMIKRLNVR